MRKNVLVPVAHGIEEIEAVSIIDILRRGGIDVRVSTLDAREVVCANGVKLLADSDFDEEVVEDYDAIILPGGTDGAKNFAQSARLTHTLKQFANDSKLIGAICASPGVVFGPLGLLDHKKATGYPALKHLIKNYVDEKVVVDGMLVTSQGPATAIPFALELVSLLVDKQSAQEVKKAILY